ncbi:MAG: hypothetical protein ACC707_20410, partial [Thiohalomonadales bacterium]
MSLFNVTYKYLTTGVIYCCVTLVSIGPLQASNIDPYNTGQIYAYGENIGWINFKPNQGPGVSITNSTFSGMAWGENIGWINFDTNQASVIFDVNGNFSGFAWAENAGWINFTGVSINAAGEIRGYAWGENIGRINFAPNNKPILTDVITPSVCESSGSNTNFEWLEAVSINYKPHTSGNNAGYADFYDSVTMNVQHGNNNIELTPGFSSGS